MSKEHEHQYCRECGAKLLSRQVPGCSVGINIMDSGGGHWRRYESPFDPSSGDTHMVEIRNCPKHKRGFFGDNKHDIFMVDGENVEWAIKVV